MSPPVHPVLGRFFAGLEARGLRWTLLRLPADPGAPTGDVDLLVAPEDTTELRDLAAELGFVAVPGWESAPDLILVHYDRPSDRWLLLDVATAVGFRAPRSWELAGMAQRVLARRELRDGIAQPADGDAFWLLLLHCLLEKDSVPRHHQRTLRRLLDGGARSPIGAAACRTAGGRLEPAAFTEAVRAGDWKALEVLGAQLGAGVRRHEPRRARVRALGMATRRVVRKPLLLPRRRGANLALLGPNGVGKSTAAHAVQRSYPFESRIVYMGVWKEAGGSWPRRVAEVAVRPLRMWGRYLLAQYHQSRGRLVIFDRYSYEALLPARPPLVTLKRLYFWLLAHALPPARAVVVLDAPGSVAFQRKQENPAEELEAERELYAGLADRVASLQLVNAADDPESVRAEINSIVWRELEGRWQDGAHA